MVFPLPIVAITSKDRPMAGVSKHPTRREPLSHFIFDYGVECTLSGGHRSGRQIDHPPGVLLFELDRAPVSERGMEPLAVVDLFDEARQ